MYEIKFTPLIWSRTKNLDYQLIISPDVIDQYLLNEIVEYIQNSTDQLKDFPEIKKPIWLLKKNNDYTVYGIVCQTSYLCDDQYYTKDISGRNCIGFFGYIFNVKILSLIKRQEKDFIELFEKVKKQWEEINNLKQTKTNWKVNNLEILLDCYQTKDFKNFNQEKSIQLNKDSTKRKIFSNDLIDMVWKEVCLSKEEVSLIYGLKQQYANTSKFLNIVIDTSIQSYNVDIKVEEPSKKSDQEKEKYRKVNSKEATTINFINSIFPPSEKVKELKEKAKISKKTRNQNRELE